MNSAFLFDTNVLSELMRSQPDVQVLKWFNAHFDAQCFTSSVTKAEIFLGIALLPFHFSVDIYMPALIESGAIDCG